MALTEAEIRALRAEADAAAAKARAAAPARKMRAEVAAIRQRYPAGSHWIEELTAAQDINRSVKTLQRWRRLGIVTTGRRRGDLVYDWFSLKAARIYMDGRQRATQIDGTVIVAGPGRPKDSTAREDIVNLLVADASMSNREIARRVGVSHTLVSSVRREWQ